MSPTARRIAMRSWRAACLLSVLASLLASPALAAKDIAYTRGCSSYAADANGLNEQWLTTACAPGEYPIQWVRVLGRPALSPDGQTVAYGDAGSGGSEQRQGLYLIDVDSRNERVIHHGGVGEFIHHPSFSPDGTKVAFWLENWYTKTGELYTIKTDGTNLTQITSQPLLDLHGYCSCDGQSAYSPNGSNIVFLSSANYGGTNPDHQFSLFKVSSKGGEARALVLGNDNFTPMNPAYSPDGKQISFDAEVQTGDSSHRDIFMVNSDGSNLQQVQKASDDADPSWTPDGQRIAFSRNYGYPTYRIHTWTMNTDGSGEALLMADRYEATYRQSSVPPDETPPTLTLSGELKDAEDFSPVQDGTAYGLDMTATDSGSGARSIEVLVDGDQKDYAEQSCPDEGCSLSRAFAFTPEDYLEGTRTIRVRAVDQVGNAAEQSWDVDVEHDVPLSEVDGSIPEGESGAAAEPTSSQSTVSGVSTTTAAQSATISDLLPCTPADEPLNFPHFSLGSAFEGLSETMRFRRCDQPYPGEPGRANFVSHIYGSCQVGADGEGCTPPLEVQSWPACERTLSDYEWGPGYGPFPHTEMELRGVPAASFDGGLQAELYTGLTTIVIFGQDPSQVLRAADALQQEPEDQPLGVPSAEATEDDLPQPVEGALEGTLPCP